MSTPPIHYERPLQFDAIHRVLIKNLGHLDEVEQLTAQICDENSQKELAQTIRCLLMKKVLIHQLLTTFSACEKDRLQYAFASTSTLPDHAQLASAKKVIAHFNQLQSLLLNVTSDYIRDCQQRSKHHIASVDEDTGNRSNNLACLKPALNQALSNSIDAWTKEKSMMVHNYYSGLAIRARVAFLGCEEGKIRLHFNEELARIFAAHPNQNTAFAICEGEEIQVRLRIEQVDEGVVVLNIDEAFPVFSESRKHLNVQVDKHVPVLMQLKGKRPIQAELHDLSMGGLGIVVQGINKSPCQISDQVQLELQFNQKEVVLAGTVRWTGISEHEARIGIELDKRFSTKKDIRKEIYRIQRDIIVTINHLEIPDNLAQAIDKAPCSMRS